MRADILNNTCTFGASEIVFPMTLLCALAVIKIFPGLSVCMFAFQLSFQTSFCRVRNEISCNVVNPNKGEAASSTRVENADK